jgi:hypothetical protein
MQEGLKLNLIALIKIGAHHAAYVHLSPPSAIGRLLCETRDRSAAY